MKKVDVVLVVNTGFLIIFLLISTIISFKKEFFPLSLVFFVMWLYSLTLIKDIINYFKEKKEKEYKKYVPK